MAEYTTIEGIVQLETVAKGSKSEREAYILQAQDETYVLRHMDHANAFEKPPQFSGLEEKTIKAEGYLIGKSILKVKTFEILDEDS